MENAVDALKMAGSVLLFVIALSVAMLAFSQAREAIDTVLKYSDREYSTIENNGRFYYLANSNDTKRYVGKETIIPTIYRSYNESYKIIFEFPDSYSLYTNTSGEKVCKIDAIEENGISDSLDFLNGIVYRKYDPKIGNFGTGTRKLEESRSLYQYLTDTENAYKIEELLGTYYLEDKIGSKGNPSEISDVNKRELRVITYKFIPR